MGVGLGGMVQRGASPAAQSATRSSPAAPERRDRARMVLEAVRSVGLGPHGATIIPQGPVRPPAPPAAPPAPHAPPGRRPPPP